MRERTPVGRTWGVVIAATLALTVATAVGQARVADDAAPAVRAIEDVVYAEHDGVVLRMDTFFPERSRAALPVVLFVHGGAFRGGSRDEGHRLCRLLARGGYFAACIEYRVVPDRYPAAARDVHAALAFVRRHAEDLGVDDTRIGLCGLRAGGHLAALVACADDTSIYAEPESQSAPPVRCLVSVSGSSDLVAPEFGARARSIIGDWTGDLGTAEGRAAAVSASPVTYVNEGDPATLLIHGREDPVVPVEQARTLLRSLRAARVEADLAVVPGGHELPEAAYLGLLLLHLDAHLGGRAATLLGGGREPYDGAGAERTAGDSIRDD